MNINTINEWNSGNSGEILLHGGAPGGEKHEVYLTLHAKPRMQYDYQAASCKRRYIFVTLSIPHHDYQASLRLASFPGPRRRRVWFQPFAHALNRSGISPLPHTIDILPYACDAYDVDAKCYNVHRFIIAAYGMQRNLLT